MSTEPGNPWLTVRRGTAPLLLCMPHTGTDIPPPLQSRFVSLWRRATRHRLVDRPLVRLRRGPGGDRGAHGDLAFRDRCEPRSVGRVALSRTGHDGTVPDDHLRRRAALPRGRASRTPARSAPARPRISSPITRAVEAELARLRARHPVVVLYDCHSIRSQVPRLFAGTLPNFNLGTYSGASCAPQLTARIEAACAATEFSRVTNGRFKGGYTTRHYGQPAGRRARHPDGARLSGLPARTARGGARGQLAVPVG